MKFDGNRAWKQASVMVRSNRELVLALAGAFFFLPSLALIMLIKQPQMASGATPDQMMAAMEQFVSAVGPWVVVGSVIQALGQLTLLNLFGHGGRPTVGQALRDSVTVMATYLVVYLLTGFMISIVLAVATGLGSLVSSVLGLAIGIYLACLVYGRFLPSSAIIALEGTLNPFTAMARAFALTRGNGFRVGNFLFLLGIAFVAVSLTTTVLAGILAAVTVGEGRVADLLTGFVSSLVAAVALAYFVAIIVAIYRQLAEEKG